MSKHSVASFIQEYYPEYWGISSYPDNKCAVFCSTHEEWGIFSNMAASPICVEGVTFKSSEHLFQMMKFKDKDIVSKIWNGITASGKNCANIKMTAKSYEPTFRREDWGRMIVDAIKYCITQKYKQCELFHQELNRSKGLHIVEKQANPNKHADAWSAKLEGNLWVGPNLTGRLLMQLRENGSLTYTLPEDAFDFIGIIKKIQGL
ncbi:MAG: NADAR family protein [Bacteroidaceae bacterium]|nr:NADAR family protein [Bacteroidaceae bacterium]